MNCEEVGTDSNHTYFKAKHCCQLTKRLGLPPLPPLDKVDVGPRDVLLDDGGGDAEEVAGK